MISNLVANATDIQNWAERLDARSELPRLVRRLVLATTPDVERLHFAAGEGVQFGGWDGITVTSVGNAFVPSGICAWEMGADKNTKGKADGDYQKRTATPLDVDPQKATFAFVTPRRWAGKEKWINSKIRENIWADVRAYDADDIETWLEQAPATHLWLSRLLGKCPSGVLPLEEFWDNWTSETVPILSPALVIGGRQAARERVETWLRGEAAALVLRGESVDESVAFLSAVIADQNNPNREELFSRSIVVEDVARWRELAVTKSRSIIVPWLHGEVSGIRRAVNNGNHIFLAEESFGGQDENSLPRILREATEKALQDMGLSDDRARHIATTVRRSLPAARRKLAYAPTIKKPLWAQPQAAQDLLGSLFAGAWQDGNLADREILARLSGVPYEELEKVLVRWSKAPDPPLRIVGSIWMIASPEDAWRLLAPYLTAANTDNFATNALEVLKSSSDHNSSIVERKGAKPSERESCVSNSLREGIASTLALMSALHSNIQFVSGNDGDAIARSVVRSLFAEAKGNIELWTSLAPVLPLLAEAAPDIFLNAVDEGLKGDTPFMRQMFHDEDSNHGMGPFSPHTYLLWALEALSWNQDLFGRAVLCLARLAVIDPGGKNGNRASSSLQNLFVVWYPNTTVSLEQRLNVLDMIRVQEPEVAWQLMLQMLPTIGGEFCTPLHGPKWHDWKPDEERAVSGQEASQAIEAIVERLLQDVGLNTNRWCDLVNRIGDVWSHLREMMLDKLDSINIALLESNEKILLCDALRPVITRHREFPDANWTMQEEHIVRLEAIEKRSEPDDLILRNLWKFQRHLRLPEPAKIDFNERYKRIMQLRCRALQEIITAHGFEGIMCLASKVEDPESVGFMIGSMSGVLIDVDAFLSENLVSLETSRRSMALGWVRRKVNDNDKVWLNDRFEKGYSIWRPEQQGEFFLPFPLEASLLDRVDGLGAKAQRHFWSYVPIGLLPNEQQVAKRVIEGLLRIGRVAVLLQPIQWALSDTPDLISVELVMDVLEIAIKNCSAEELLETHYASAELLDSLFKMNAPRERLARLEWLYFGEHEYMRVPKVLHTELGCDPDFFVEILSLIYRARPGETETDERKDVALPSDSRDTLPPDPQEEQRKMALARRALSLLWHWHQMPGVREDGTIDEEHLKSWVNNAREAAKKRDRCIITLNHIGQALAHSPRDEDETWPHRSVRDIIEEIANPRLELGFHCQVMNNRGVTSRGATEGGAQERILVEQYESYAARVAGKWPRTAEVLRGIARDYRQQAEYEDRSAELTQDFWR